MKNVKEYVLEGIDNLILTIDQEKATKNGVIKLLKNLQKEIQSGLINAYSEETIEEEIDLNRLTFETNDVITNYETPKNDECETCKI